MKVNIKEFIAIGGFVFAISLNLGLISVNESANKQEFEELKSKIVIKEEFEELKQKIRKERCSTIQRLRKSNLYQQSIRIDILNDPERVVREQEEILRLTQELEDLNYEYRKDCNH